MVVTETTGIAPLGASLGLVDSVGLTEGLGSVLLLGSIDGLGSTLILGSTDGLGSIDGVVSSLGAILGCSVTTTSPFFACIFLDISIK